jgi:hypothetical protein
MDDRKLQSLGAAGAVLALSALAAAVLMHHHPHGGDGAGLVRAVHGGLIMLIAVQPAVLALVACALGWRLLTAQAAALFALGTLAAILAGTINGFVAPALGAYPAGEIALGVGAFGWELNQALARLGAIATGAGIVLFAAALWQAGWRFIGGAGVLAGGLTAALLVTGIIDMRFYGAMFTYIAQLAWLALLGGALFRAARAVSLPSTP